MSEARRAAESMRQKAAEIAFIHLERVTLRQTARIIRDLIIATPLPDATPDPRDAALAKATEALSAVSSDDCAEHSCRIKPETLAKARKALLAISRLSSWWGAQQIALDALEATKGTDDAQI